MIVTIYKGLSSSVEKLHNWYSACLINTFFKERWRSNKIPTLIDYKDCERIEYRDKIIFVFIIVNKHIIIIVYFLLHSGTGDKLYQIGYNNFCQVHLP